MQYSYINVLNRTIILDLQEARYLQTFLKTKSMPELQAADESSLYRYKVYGAILHNPDCEIIDHKKWLNYEFAYPDATGFKTLSICDIYTRSSLISAKLTFTPFAALVESNYKLSPEPGISISAFLRFDDMDIITNFINRECIYAMRHFEMLDANLRNINWKKTIDEEEMIKIAISIQ